MAETPNILHLFVDQQRADTIRALGNPVIKTPSLDRLCARGTAFTSAFSPSPVCISARCSMIFGQYPMHTGCYENTRMPVDDRQTFMAALSDVGYRTHGIGKCHFSPDPFAMRGFQSRDVLEEGGGRNLEQNPYLKLLFDKGYTHICEPHGIRGEMYYIPQPSQLPASLHPTQWVGDRAIDFIGSQSGDQPWYLFSSFIHPHPPFTPPNPWHKLYRAPLMPLPHVPADSDTLLTYVNRVQNRYKYRDQGIDRNLLRNMKAFYYACISFIDYQIGRILDTLERAGQLENTLIVFTSDHGEYLGDFNCFGKRSMHDPAAHIPMLVSLPGRLPEGVVCTEPASLVDVAPTILGAAGTGLGSHPADGVDLADLAAGRATRDMVFAQLAYNRGANLLAKDPLPAELRENPDLERASASTYMAVSKEWKYFYSAADHRDFLFDRIHDPAETRNRAGLVFCAEARKTMRTALIEHLREGGETAGIEGDTWRRFPRMAVDENPDAGLLVQDGYTPWTDVRIPGYTD